MHRELVATPLAATAVDLSGGGLGIELLLILPR
jgi:hypothetical protein